MVFARGQRQDFDDWQAEGNPGWGWKTCCRISGRSRISREGFGRAGKGRPASRHRSLQPGASALRKLPRRRRAGRFLPARTTTMARPRKASPPTRSPRGRASARSAATAFLAPAMRRSNVAVVTGATVTRILIEDGRASGIEYVRAGKVETARANGEVILSAGAINSPALPASLRHRTRRAAQPTRRACRQRSCPQSAKTCRTISASTTSSGRGNRPSTQTCEAGSAGRGWG